MSVEPALSLSFAASPTGPRVVLAVFDGCDAGPPHTGPSVFAPVHGTKRPPSESIARTLAGHVVPALRDAGHGELAALLFTLARAPNAILATGGPVPPHLGAEGETVLFVQIYRGVR